MERVAPQTIVRNKGTGKKGVAVDDLPGMMRCCSEQETPVVYEGETFSSGTDTVLLEVIGPEGAVADLEKCGGGKGAECCIFLALGAKGASCERFGSLRWNIIFREGQMGAKRHPAELFPDCQLK